MQMPNMLKKIKVVKNFETQKIGLWAFWYIVFSKIYRYIHYFNTSSSFASVVTNTLHILKLLFLIFIFHLTIIRFHILYDFHPYSPGWIGPLCGVAKKNWVHYFQNKVPSQEPPNTPPVERGGLHAGVWAWASCGYRAFPTGVKGLSTFFVRVHVFHSRSERRLVRLLPPR